MPGKDELLAQLEAVKVRLAGGASDPETLKEAGDLNLALYEESGEADFLSQAVSFLEQAMEKDPTNPRVLANLGLAYLESGSPTQSMATLKRVLMYPSLDPKPHFVARYLLGKIYMSLDQVREATENFREALILDPGNVPAMIDLGVALAKRGRLKEAREEFRRALQLDPGNELATRNLQAIEGETDETP
ncbi:MAG: tetratricopeptide repeat protein [bacterium JZ-2024 1]